MHEWVPGLSVSSQPPGNMPLYSTASRSLKAWSASGYISRACCPVRVSNTTFRGAPLILERQGRGEAFFPSSGIQGSQIPWWVQEAIPKPGHPCSKPLRVSASPRSILLCPHHSKIKGTKPSTWHGPEEGVFLFLLFFLFPLPNTKQYKTRTKGWARSLRRSLTPV